jgi:hypothetical protein
MTWDYKEWYKRGGGRQIAKRRKKRRETDEQYRERISRESRQSYHRRTADTPKYYGKRSVDENGNLLFSVGNVAKSIGKSVITVRKYCEKGIIQEPRHRSSRNWRMFTEGQYILIKKAFQLYGEGKFLSLTDVGNYLESNWEE